MARTMAPAGRGQVYRVAARTRWLRGRVCRIRAVDRGPAIAGLPGPAEPARYEGWALFRRRRGRAIRRLRRLERAGGDLAPSVGRRPARSVEYRRPELGPGGLQRRRPRHEVVRAVSGDDTSLDASRRRDPARPCDG